MGNKYQKYHAAFRQLELEDYGYLEEDETWWYDVMKSIDNKTTISYESTWFIPSAMYDELIGDGWRDTSNTQAECGGLEFG